MTKVTMEMVKELREKTQVGMMDCKRALIEADGDMEKSIELLRKKGSAVAAKRSGNATENGRIEVSINDAGTAGAMVEVSCETDFSANTDAMKDFGKTIANYVLTHAEDADTQKILDAKIESKGLKVSEFLEELISKITEKITISNITQLSSETGIINAYIHAGSTLGIMIALDVEGKTSENTPKLMELAKNICMQIAVSNPLSIDPSQLDATTIEKEKDVLTAQLQAAGKPENIIEKIMIGKMAKYYEEVCLLNQKYIKEDKTTIAKHIAAVAKETSAKITVKEFKRFSIGK
jgi:elongation factor Ts